MRELKGYTVDLDGVIHEITLNLEEEFQYRGDLIRRYEEDKFEYTTSQIVEIFENYGGGAVTWTMYLNNESAQEAAKKYRVQSIKGGCPCLYVEPCSINCSCANQYMSGGCMRCCTYGSFEQRVAMAQHLVSILEDNPTEAK